MLRRGTPRSLGRSFLAALASLLLLQAIGASAAGAVARPPLGVPSYLNQTVTGPHFIVHYTPNQGDPAGWLSQQGAESALANAEAAYARYVGQWGYPAPANDGDGKTDVYVFDFPLSAAAGRDSETSDQTSGYLLLDPSDAVSPYAVAHELFHVIQFGIFSHSGFFSESSAEWAGQAMIAANGGSPPPNWYPYPYLPLDCLDPSCGGFGGYQGSIFWEYLAERFGMDIAHAAYGRLAVLGAVDHQAHALQALQEVLAARGSSLTAAFEGYALAAMAGQITRPGVLPHRPAADHAFIAGEALTYLPDTLTVDHLSLKAILFEGAEPESSAPCRPATLHLRVQLPPGLPTQPFFVTYPPSGGPPATGVYPLALAGAGAGADVPWSLCAGTIGALTLPNASTNTDNAAFSVYVSVSMNPSARLRAPRLSGKSRQDVDRLSISARSLERVKLSGQATVSVPVGRGRAAVLRSLPARGRAAANQAARLRFRFARAKLRQIKAGLRRGSHLSAKIRVTASNAAGDSASAAKAVSLKP